MEYAVVNVPAAPVRRKPSHKKEMVSQLLFGETVKVLKTKGELWIKIRSMHDNYEGWITNSLVEEVEEKAAINKCIYVTADTMSFVTAANKKINISVASSLPFFQDRKILIGDMEYVYEGHYLNRFELQPNLKSIEQLCLPWLNAPYLWGGRTPLGVDCSGFVQVIFKQMGIDLPRDAWQQAQEGKSIKKYKDSQPGDLAFFNNKEDIVHVGILLGNEQIIHSSGKVKIDHIDKRGIIDSSTNERILKLQAIRRLI